jgi:hypothetical protein
VVFSWLLDQAYQRAAWHKAAGKEVFAGGPAVSNNPDSMLGIADIDCYLEDAIAKHNPNATFTSRGCIRNCSFCAVPKMEGGLIELYHWPVRPIVCDNNILACSKAHFDGVIDKLRPIQNVDFNQGLDARLLTTYHAEKLRELDLTCVRLAWDHTKMEHSFFRAYQVLRRAGFTARKIKVYVLIGFNDSPEDALYRLETVKSLGSRPNPMRYQPIDTKEKNGYVDPNWTDKELNKYMRYWSRLRYLEHIPFAEFDNKNRGKTKVKHASI